MLHSPQIFPLNQIMIEAWWYDEKKSEAKQASVKQSSTRSTNAIYVNVD